MLQADALVANGLRRLNKGPSDIMIANDAEFVRNLCFLCETDCRRHAGIGNGHDNIGLRRRFAGELCAHRFAHVINVAAANDGIGPGEINVFKDAGTRGHGREWLVRLRAFLIEDHHFAVFNVAYILSADYVESAGLGSEYGAAVQLADHKGSDTERIARPDELFVSQPNERISALELAQPLDETVDKAIASGARNEMQDDLSVGRRLHHCAFVDEVAPQLDAVGEVAVVSDGKAAAFEFCEQR